MSDLAYIGTPLAEARFGDGNGDGNGGGGGGGSSNGMEPRIEHLEHRMGRVEDKLDTIIERLGAVATRADMRNYLIGALAICIAVVGAIVTAMGWLETRATRVATPPAPAVQPIVIQVPQSATPAPQAAQSRHR